MRIWTIQPIEVWHQVQEVGYAEVDPARTRTPDFTPPAYLWLVEELKQRLPGYTGKLPWWAYLRKPDLRVHRHRMWVEESVRLEIETEQAIAFPIWAWNQVYCQSYLALSREDYEEAYLPFEDLDEVPEEVQERCRQSWGRLFDPALPAKKPYPDGGFFTLTSAREAVFERIHRHEVKKVTPFTTVDTMMRRINAFRAARG